MLRRRIAEDMQLPKFARAGRYLLRYLSTYDEVPCGSIFTLVFRPGARLIMPLLVSYDDKNVDFCPACRSPNDNTEKSTLQCGVCELVYTPSKVSFTHITMQPAHRKSLSESSEAETTVNEEIIHPPVPVVSDALERLQCLPASNDFRFKIVQNFKHVDVSSPRMMLVLDLLGYMYTVPWHMVRTADQMDFFLQFFTAGGLILDWTHDYVVVDDRNSELTPANWESGAHPGISITLHLKNRGGPIALRKMLTSKIEDVVSASALAIRGQGLQDSVDKVCLLVGASNAQFEMKGLVREAVVSHWTNRNAGYCSSRLLAVETRPVPAPSCLICHKILFTSPKLAKHALCHLISRRCEEDCSTCNAKDPLYFGNEDASQRRGNCATEARMEHPIIDPHKGDGGGGGRNPRRWVCCHCRQTSMPGNCPDRCPVDGHLICHHCYGH